MGKRADGALELDVMRVLWAATAPLTPGDVREQLPHPLAYTSVATVLGRLQSKGLVRRLEAGRAFGYEAAIDEAQWAVQRMTDVLSSTNDRAGVLVGFVGSLSKKEAKALRALLGESSR